MLEQLAFNIGKNNMYPAPKIFANAARLHKNYEKCMREIGLADIVVAVVKKKEAKGQKNLEAVVKKKENDFGFSYCQYAERNKLDMSDWFQAIETLKANFTEEDIDSTLLKKMRNQRTQQSVAAIIARRYIDM